VDGVPTFNVRFKRGADSATYFVRAKPGGAVSGSLTRTEGGKTLRYVIGAPAEGAAGAGKRRAATEPSDGAAGERGDASPAFDERVLRVDGAFVRLMSVQAAMADAGVSVDKAKVGAILKAAGAEQNALRAKLAAGALAPAEYAQQAEAVLVNAREALAQLAGDKARAVEDAYANPFAGTYVFLNRARAAAALVGTGQVDKRADQAVYESLMELTRQARQPGQLTPEAAAALRDRTRAAVRAALAEEDRKPFEAALAGMAAGDPGGGEPATKPATRRTEKLPPAGPIKASRRRMQSPPATRRPATRRHVPVVRRRPAARAGSPPAATDGLPSGLRGRVSRSSGRVSRSSGHASGPRGRVSAPR
jgi:hypothetical protein